MRKEWIAMLAACAVSGAAMAADQPTATGRPGWDRAAMQQRHAAREAKRADEIALLLGLRPDQRPAFDRFMQSMRPSHDGPGGMHDAAMRKPGDDAALPARLDAMEASIDRHDTMAKQKIAATRQFYAGLTPDQQHRFDALEDLRHDRGGHGRRGGWGGPRRMGAPGGSAPAAPVAG